MEGGTLQDLAPKDRVVSQVLPFCPLIIRNETVATPLPILVKSGPLGHLSPTPTHQGD